ncbi:MAG: prepilin-type N-terminal cleavage/methylation domain-containing protein [bacterium]
MLQPRIRNQQSAIRNRNGLTLVEVIVVIVLAAVVVSLIYGVYTTTFRLGRKGLTQINRLEEARLALDQIARDISGAVSFVNDKDGDVMFQGKKGDIPNLDSDSLIIIVGNSKMQNQGKLAFSLQKISYTVETSLVGKVGEANRQIESRINRVITDVDETKSNDTTNIRRLGIGLPNVKYGLQFRYWDSQLPTGPGWVEEWMNRPNLPKQVRVIVTVQHPNEPGGTLKLSTIVKIMGS